ncbi:hypothetical protein A1O7_00576 [Cladophialophora yegresii CBS 114405]|uniref:BZIP domain-containing protein n=1 Tax=Cladophialophora yegresii CBS 114405 TaxID=1182544 RepID=W9WGW3_9EURO|nr:uncharacterized protein A1O7_00576 [Cladophialophora yegresii CBS 114405]EXJ64240.1 hypothetical protein A1O7_00576 [Cladophialophora yegresii CBS 114405]
MAFDGSAISASTAPKSKQERIRDNQRRSRARRQEYLADLERRVKECHTNCREAELQRSAFNDLQVENARLRDILNAAGINPDFVEAFGRQNETGQAVAAAHRQIRPKFQPPFSGEQSDTTNTITQSTSPGQCCPPTSASSQVCPSAPVLPMDAPGAFGNQHAVPFMAAPSTNAMDLPLTADMSPTLEGWSLRLDDRESMEIPFCCDTFANPSDGPPLTDDGNTIQCSVAKMMIDQYHPTPTEMEEIKARLAAGFALPRSSEPGCRVNTQLLFDVMQDMNSRELYG